MLYNLCQSLRQATSQALLQILRLHPNLLTINRQILGINVRIKLGGLKILASGAKHWLWHYFLLSLQFIQESYLIVVQFLKAPVTGQLYQSLQKKNARPHFIVWTCIIHKLLGKRLLILGLHYNKKTPKLKTTTGHRKFLHRYLNNGQVVLRTIRG